MSSQPPGVETISIEQVLELEQKLRENKAAQLRGEPPVHEVTPEQIHAALSSMRRSRGTMELAKSGGSKSSKPKIELIDLEGL